MYENVSLESNKATPSTKKPIVPAVVELEPLKVVGFLGIRYVVAVLLGKLGKFLVFASLRYQGPILCNPRPEVFM